jgi:cardiolipin synthase
MDAITAFFMENWLDIISWTIRLGALVIVPFRRSAAEARTWLLIFFIFPILALFIYLAIGRPEHSNKRRALFEKLPDVMARIVKRSGLEDNIADAVVPDGAESSSKLGYALGGLPALAGNAVALLPDYDEMVARLVRDIEGASHHVHLEFYIFAYDKVGKKVMAALASAQSRGVKCRVLIDAMGSMTSARKVERRLQKYGIEVHRILPLLRRGRSSRIDLRNHRKIVVIDGKIGYTGSQNMIEAKINAKFSHRELMARVEGPVVSELQAIFLSDWFLETEEELEQDDLFAFENRPGDITAQVIPSGPDFQAGGIDLFFTKIINDAEQEIVIVTPYFVPNDALLAAMRTAAMRGIKVRLIVSQKSDSLLVKLAQRSYYDNLLKAGVDICIYQADFLHAKQVRIDQDMVVIGSSNMDQRSFELNAEISLICFGSQITSDVQAIEKDYLAHCVTIDQAQWNKRPLLVKLIENMARMLSDLL